MVVIKFSHYYSKFPRDYQLSKLLDVLPVKLQELSLDFLLYDTTYQEWDPTGKVATPVEKQYPLPMSGNYMLILLQAGSGHGRLWTTLRSQKGRSLVDKLLYYRGHVGEVVECKVIES